MADINGKKTGGRVKGAQNRETRFAREIVEAALGMNPIQAVMKKLEQINDDKFFVTTIKDLMPYMYPKLAQQELKIEAKANINASVEQTAEIQNYKDQIRAQLECEAMMSQSTHKLG